MLDWPEQTQTSPKRTSLMEMVAPSSAYTVMVYGPPAEMGSRVTVHTPFPGAGPGFTMMLYVFCSPPTCQNKACILFVFIRPMQEVHYMMYILLNLVVLDKTKFYPPRKHVFMHTDASII